MLGPRLKVRFLRSSIQLQSFFVSWFGSAPYHTKFTPNRSFTIKSSSSSRKIKVNVFEPPEFDPDPSKKYPVYLNFHGSVFIIPSLGTDADFCRIVSNRTGSIVLDCDYAKAPEWPFPAAPEDVKDAIDYVLANKEGYFDISRVAIGGFSVGGTLALTAGASQPKGILKGAIAMYPATELSIDHRNQAPPRLSDGNSNPLPSWLLHLGYSCYIPPSTNLSDPRLSPVNMDVSSLPEHILLVVCEEDSLRDEAVSLAYKFKAAGVQADLKEMPRMVHAWDKRAQEKTPAGAARHEAYEAAWVDMFLRSLLGTAEYSKFPPQRRFKIPSTTSARKIRINVYEPKNFDKSKRYAVHLNFHGSGFMICMLGTDGDFCHLVSQQTGAIVLDCDYAKGPEYPFPAAPNDVRDVIAYVTANKEGYFDTSRITIGGFSAGGTLALTAGVGQPRGTLKGVIAFYPCVDLSLDTAIRAPPPLSEGNSNPIPPWFNELVRDSYTPHGTDMSDPRLSPINTPPTTLPEHALVVVCEEDPLRYDAVEYVKRLKKMGTKILLKEVPKAIHIWDKRAKKGTPGGATKDDAYKSAVEMLKLAYGT